MSNILLLIEALESGRYQQTRGQLKSNDGTSYCCMGVACEIYMQQTGRGEWVNPTRDGISLVPYFKVGTEVSSGGLVEEIREWFGIISALVLDTPKNQHKYIRSNDTHHMSFNEIAAQMRKDFNAPK